MTDHDPRHLTRYILPSEFDTSTLHRQLRASFKCIDSESEQQQLIYLDTFDWRLYRSNLLCSYVQAKRVNVIRLEDLRDEKVVASAPAHTLPRFADDIPPGVLACRVKPITAIRSMLPLIRLNCEQHSWKIKNLDDKIVFSIVLQECIPINSSTRAQGKAVNTPIRLLTIHPVKGYALPIKDLSDLLEKQLKLKPISDNLLQQLTPWLAYPPGSHSDKFRPRLDEQQPAQLAVKAIFRELLETLEENENGILHDLDTEFLHDFRVALRRTRSGLKQIKQVIPEPRARRFDREFSWLAGNTGRLRDLDVLLLKFEHYREMLPSSLRPHLDPLHSIVLQQRDPALQQVTRALTSKRYAKLKQDWITYLSQDIVTDQSCPLAREPIIEVAQTDIWCAFQRIIKRGDKIRADSPSDDYHRLRKTCKQLRYLVEFFQSLFPAKQIKLIRNNLTAIQDLLGEFQDLSVQTDELQDYAKAHQAQSFPPQTLLAIGALIEKFEQRKRDIRAHYEQVFHEFYSKENTQRYKQLFFSPEKE